MSESQYLVHFGPNANCTFELCSIDDSVYGYRPSLGANVALLVLFATAMAVHIFLGLKWKTRSYMWCMMLGCTQEMTGYIGRILLYRNPWNFAAFILQIICITQAPVCYCAAIYITLAQTVNHFSPGLARFPPKYFYWVFLPCDIISLVLQGCGGGLSAASVGTSETGVDIAMAGLIFQVVTLIAFCTLLGDFLFRYIRSQKENGTGGRAKIFFSFMTIAIIAILIRCIFRTNELKEGYSGEMIKREDLFIALEGALIVVAAFALCIGHPGLVLNKDGQEYASTAKVEEEIGEI